MPTTTVVSKGWATSKMMWLGALNVAAAVIEFLTTQPLLEQYWQYLLMANGILVIVLRSITTQPLASSPLQDQTKVVEAPPSGDGQL